MTEQTSNSGAATGSSGGSSQKRKAAVFPHSELTRSIIGGLFDVHSELGAGFLERVYANGLAVVLRARGLRVEREVPYEIHFRGKIIGRYVADMVVESAVVVEIKAAEKHRTNAPRAVAELLARLGPPGRSRAQLRRVRTIQANDQHDATHTSVALTACRPCPSKEPSLGQRFSSARGCDQHVLYAVATEIRDEVLRNR